LDLVEPRHELANRLVGVRTIGLEGFERFLSHVRASARPRLDQAFVLQHAEGMRCCLVCDLEGGRKLTAGWHAVARPKPSSLDLASDEVRDLFVWLARISWVYAWHLTSLYVLSDLEHERSIRNS
jgi:hypothetical protein